MIIIIIIIMIAMHNDDEPMHILIIQTVRVDTYIIRMQGGQ